MYRYLLNPNSDVKKIAHSSGCADILICPSMLYWAYAGFYTP